MYDFERIEYSNIDWDEYNRYSRKSVWTTKEWMDFVISDSNTEPLIFRIKKNGTFIGYAPFMIVRKLGGILKIAGSPFRGWSTCWMGIEVEDIEEKIQIIREISKLLFKKYGCLYCEIVDRDIPMDTALSSGFTVEPWGSLELKIDCTDEELWKKFKTDCRNFIRQFERRGAVLTEAEPDEEFAKEYYNELIDVFAKQNLVPSYSLEKVERLLSNMKTTGRLLCLRVRTPEGQPAASSIFFADEQRFYFWGGASYREHQHYRPNEYMLWYAIRYWRERGVKVVDMVGERAYKRKFGSVHVDYPMFKIGKYKAIVKARDLAERIYFKMMNLKFQYMKK